jgi:glycosyltransferase involved in cell wall biosynthesis
MRPTRVHAADAKAFADVLERHGVHVQTLGVGRTAWRPLQLIRAGLRLRRHVRARRPDIVHAHMVHANLLSRVCLALSGSRLICTVHNARERPARELAYRLTNWASRLDTTVSENARTAFVDRHVLRPSAVAVHNGVDLSRFGNERPEQKTVPFRWIAVGRVRPVKDYPNLLRALAKLDSATLAIAGDDAVGRAALETLAGELGIGGRVAFLGIRNDVPALLMDYDGFVMPSLMEGFGIALVEAMASRLPAVATDCGGPGEVLGDDGLAGLLAPPGDSVALARAMMKVMALPTEARAAMGEAGRARAIARFDIRRALDRWESIYAAIIAGSPVSVE